MIVFLFLLLAQNPPARNPHTSAVDLTRGKQLYDGLCAGCHGPAGEGGKGANLARPTLPRGRDDQALFDTIRRGIPGTEMPPSFMIDREIWQVAAHVRTLGRTTPQPLPGSAAEGEKLFRGKGNCGQCHVVDFQGGNLGPVLDEIGARRSPAYLRESLLNPEAAIPDGFLYLQVRARDGRNITGIRLNEDTYSIQLRDLSGNLHSFWKADLAEIQRRYDKSPMPSYKGVFTEAELDHLIAYLASLRGAL